MSNIFNIVFSESTRGTLKCAYAKNYLEKEKLISFVDDLSNGLIDDLMNLKNREKFWNTLDSNADYRKIDVNEYKENYREFYENINKINDDDILYFWYRNSNREICAMLYTLYLLRNKKSIIYIVSISDEVKEKRNEKAHICRAKSYLEMREKQLVEDKALARKIEKHEYTNLVDLWSTLVKENSMSRSLVNGKMVSIPVDYLDIEILKTTEKEYKKCARTVGQILGDTDFMISDSFIFYRIRELISKKLIEYKGKFGIMREMEIRISKEGLEYIKEQS